MCSIMLNVGCPETSIAIAADASYLGDMESAPDTTDRIFSIAIFPLTSLGSARVTKC